MHRNTGGRVLNSGGIKVKSIYHLRDPIWVLYRLPNYSFTWKTTKYAQIALKQKLESS